MLTPEAEVALRMDIREGVQYALSLGIEEGRFDESSIQLDRVRLNELQYLAARGCDLGLTFGWFEYGPAPADTAAGTAETFRSRSGDRLSPRSAEDRRPRSGEELDRPAESRLPATGHRSPEAFAAYFLGERGDEFDRIVTAPPTKASLVEFYETYAPQDDRAAPFVDLYTASARLQQTLDRLVAGQDWHDDATGLYYEADERLRRVEAELRNHDPLAETVAAAVAYRRLLTSVVAEAVAEPALSPRQQAYLGSVVQTFYGTIWNFVAHEVSLATIRGDNAAALRPVVAATAERYREGAWREELTSLSDRREAVGLAADLDDDGALATSATSAVTDDTQSLDDDLVRGVAEAGSEVIDG